MIAKVKILLIIFILIPLCINAQNESLEAVKKEAKEYLEKFAEMFSFEPLNVEDEKKRKTKKLNKKDKNEKIKDAKATIPNYFYDKTKEAICEDFGDEDAPPLIKSNKYITGLFTTYSSVEISFEDEIFIDEPKKLTRGEFSCKKEFKDVIFKGDEADELRLKPKGVINKMKNAKERHSVNFIRTGFVRDFRAVTTTGEKYSERDTIYLFWVHHESKLKKPKILLSCNKANCKEFDSKFNNSPPPKKTVPPKPKVNIEDEVANKVETLYKTLNANKAEPLGKIISEYFVNGEVFVASTLSLEGEKSELRAMGYLVENLRLKPKHKLDILDVGKTPEGEYKVEANLTTTIINEADTITNKASISILVKTKKENDKISSILISGITSGDIEHNKKSPKVIAQPPRVAPDPQPKSQNQVNQELAREILNTTAPEKVQEFGHNADDVAKNGRTKKSDEAFNTLFKENSTIEVSTYNSSKIKTYSVSEYPTHIDTLSYDQKGFSFESITPTETLINNGAYWVGEVLIQQHFSGIYFNKKSQSYCDITTKIAEIIIYGIDNLRIGNIRVVNKTRRDKNCTAIEP